MKGGGMRLSDHGYLLLLSNSSLCGFVRQKHCEEYSLIVSLAPLLGLSNTLRCRFILGEWFVSLSFSICLHCRLAKEKCRKGIVTNFSPSVWLPCPLVLHLCSSLFKKPAEDKQCLLDSSRVCIWIIYLANSGPGESGVRLLLMNSKEKSQNMEMQRKEFAWLKLL